MLNAIFYPVGTPEKPISFDSLYIPYIYKEIYFDGVYLDIFNGKSDLTVIDVGANIGVVTQYMRQYCKKLYAIEPSTEHFEALKKNKEFNNWDNVEVFNMAMADSNGEMDLMLNEGNHTMHSLLTDEQAARIGSKYKVASGPLGRYAETEKVKTVTFDSFMEQNNIEKVDFCKLDIEGAEDMVLRSEGFRKVANRIKAIEIEFHFPDWTNLADYLVNEFGFTPRRYDCSAIVVLFTR